MGWLNKFVEEAKYAHDINHVGPAYVYAEQAAKELESEGKTEEAKEIRAAMLDNTVNVAMTAGLAKGILGAGKELLRKQLMPAIRLGAGMAGGIGGMYAGDKLVHTLSDGKYDTWGDMIQDKTKGAIGSTLAHLSNPLAILGGFAGARGAGKAYASTKRGKIDVLSEALDGMIDNTNFKQSIDILTWVSNLNTEDTQLLLNFYKNGASSRLEAEKIFSLFKQTNPDIHGILYGKPQIEMLPCGVNNELIPVLNIGHLTASDLDKLVVLILKKRALTFKEMVPGARLLFINKLDEAANSTSYLIVPMKPFKQNLNGFFNPIENRSYIIASPLNTNAGSTFFHESVMHYTDNAVKGLGKGLNIDGKRVPPLSADHIYQLGGSGIDLAPSDVILKTVKYPISILSEEIRASVGESLRDIVSDILYYKEATPDQLINNPQLLEKLIHLHTLAGFGNAMHRNWRNVNTKYTTDYKNIQSILPTQQKYKYADRWVNMLKYMPATALLLGTNNMPKNENTNDYKVDQIADDPSDFKAGGKLNYLNLMTNGYRN